MTDQREVRIFELSRNADGPSMSYEAAKVRCSECEGWTGLVCPHGCGVRVESIQAQRDAECRARMKQARDEHTAVLAEIRARRATS